ncbi:MAG: hypothetical protein JW699_03960 [Chitinispirillaceae bacterium]|nr:hypothetical protein [Chitinispirillaceae bacterium]
MDELRDTIREFSDEQLRTAFFREKEQYTDAAIEVIRTEMFRRGLSEEPDKAIKEERAAAVRLNSEDFVRFDCSFSRMDLTLAAAILRDNGIPFFVDNPTSSDSIPTEVEAGQNFSILVHNASLDKAHALLDEHFVKSDRSYLLKYTEARERLKAFNFNDIHLTEKVANEELDVGLDAGEKNIIIGLGERLLREAEQIEQKQERVLFYYDSIEPLIGRLQEPERIMLSRNDLLTILEILQVYADDAALPSSMDGAIHQLLAFFLQP